MKIVVLILSFVIFFSLEVKANKLNEQNQIECLFAFNTGVMMDGQVFEGIISKALYEFLILVDFNVDSKEEWKINKISYLGNLIKIVEDLRNEDLKLWKKVFYSEKINDLEKKQANSQLKTMDLTLNQVQNELKKYKKKEIDELFKQYTANVNSQYDELLPIVEDLMDNQKKYSKELIQDFDKYKEISNKNNQVIINLVTSGGAQIKSLIDYPEILNENSVDTVSMRVTFADTSSITFDSRCKNKTPQSKIKNSLTDPITKPKF
jgi:hypothetical protein